MSEFTDVRDMYRHFGLVEPGARPPHALDAQTMRERIAFLREEVEELEAAAATGDLPGMADALADLKVVACGTEALMDLPADEVWAEVHRANMAKVAGAGRHHGHRPGADLIKPPGWRAPDHAPILRARGWHDDLPAAKDDVDPAAQSIAYLACGRPTVNGRQPCPGCSETAGPEAAMDRTSAAVARLVAAGAVSPCTICDRVPGYLPEVCDGCEAFRAWERARPRATKPGGG